MLSSRFAATLLLATLLPSCAYMQTNKNVEELGRSYPGYSLEKPKQLHRADNTWYVEATPADYRLHHDYVHDNVFRKTNEPEMQLLGATADSPAYHSISPNTAAVLLRPDGFATSEALAKELAESPAPWLTTLPHTTTHAVQARVEGKDSIAVTGEPSPAEVSLGYRLLSGLDFLIVDIPGTLLYNIAVPVIAPFVFFDEFLEEQ